MSVGAYAQKETRTVLKGGRIKWNGELRHHPFLIDHVGERVRVEDFFGDDYNDISVATTNREFICYIGGNSCVVEKA